MKVYVFLESKVLLCEVFEINILGKSLSIYELILKFLKIIQKTHPNETLEGYKFYFEDEKILMNGISPILIENIYIPLIELSEKDFDLIIEYYKKYSEERKLE